MLWSHQSRDWGMMGRGSESFWKGAFELDFEGMNMNSLEVCDVPFIQQTFTYTLSLDLG